MRSKGVRTESINAFVPSNAKHRSDLDIRYANEFIENSVCDDYLNLAYFIDGNYCLSEFNFDKELLCIDDATLVKIKDYDNEKTKEELHEFYKKLRNGDFYNPIPEITEYKEVTLPRY